jgi:hypothetical protein
VEPIPRLPTCPHEPKEEDVEDLPEDDHYYEPMEDDVPPLMELEAIVHAIVLSEHEEHVKCVGVISQVLGLQK